MHGRWPQATRLGGAHGRHPPRGHPRRRTPYRTPRLRPAEGADDLILDLYKRIPDTCIADILMEVDSAIAFTDTFPHLRTGVPCRDSLGLLNVRQAEEINLGLAKMAESTNPTGTGT